MALTAMKGKRRKTVTRIAGRLNDDMKHYGGLPLFSDNMTDEQFTKEFNRAVNMYACTGTTGERAKATLEYVKANRKKDLKWLKLVSEGSLAIGLGTYCRVWQFSGKFTQSGQTYVDNKIDEIINRAKKLSTKKEDEPVKSTLTPQDRIKIKVENTIISQLNDMEDEWIMGEKTDRDVYTLCKSNNIAGGAVQYIVSWTQPLLDEMNEVLTTKDTELKQAFKHIPTKEIKRQISVLENILADCEKLKASKSATRKVRIKKPQAADKQVAKLKYLKESSEYKITSVNPLLLVGASRVILFNTKNKQLCEYITERAGGFEVKGQALQHINKARAKTLRKPEVFLPIALKKTPKQFDKEFSELKSVEKIPNGRFNDSMVILLVK